jgi:preprotein translocase subunit SecG
MNLNIRRWKTVTILNTIITVVFIILSIALTVVILMQEGKSAGLGAIAGAADTYWGKNKGRSMEGMLVKLTRVGVILFLLLALALNLGIWN